MKKKLKLKNSVITILVVILFLFISFILFSAAYFIYKNNREVSYYNGDKNYSYIEVSSISNPIAESKGGKFYFVTDKDDKIYVVFISDKKIKKIKNKTRIYGYPTVIDDDLRNIIIKDINKNLSYDKRLDINDKNYKDYVTGYFLDSTVNAKYKFNYIVFILLILFYTFIILCTFYLHRKKVRKYWFNIKVIL